MRQYSTKMVVITAFLAMVLAVAAVMAACPPARTDDGAPLGSDKNPVVVPHAVDRITVDGDLCDWSRITALPAPYSKKDAGAVKLAWREDGLYGCAEVKVAKLTVEEIEPWKADCIELWLELDDVRGQAMGVNDCQIVLAAKPSAGAGKCVVLAPRGPIRADAVTAFWKPVDGGYQIEFLIPAKELVPATMAGGTKLAFNYAINKMGKAEEQFFCDKNKDNAYSNPSVWGVIQFDKGAVAEGGAASDPVEPPIAPAMPADPTKPVWASATGVDPYGEWAELTVGKVTQRFRLIKPGTFTMGSPQAEKDMALASDPGCKREELVPETQHEVTISRSFWLADSTCSQGLWYSLMPAKTWVDPKKPLSVVSWDDCQLFIQKLNQRVPHLNVRLPTEAEWEYACRAGTTTAFNFGPLSVVEKKVLNLQYHPILLKSLPPNAWGLYEMHGNLWQWCSDWYGDYAAGAQCDPVGPASGRYRVMRGGCFLDLPWRSRSAYRSWSYPDVRLSGMSIRLAAQFTNESRTQANPVATTSTAIVMAPTTKPVPVAAVSTSSRTPGWASATGTDAMGNWADLTIEKTTQRFRLIKPGTFIMGSPQAEKEAALANALLEYKVATPAWFASEVQHEVKLTQGCWMADTACSQGFWMAVMGSNPSRYRGDSLPANQISWQDSQEFIKKLNALVPGLDARLPTEAEWEYACRAGTTTAFSFGATITPEQACYNGRGEFAGGCNGPCPGAPVPVKSLPHNAWGLYEMHGNIRQWCSDWLADFPGGPQTDPTGPLTSPRGERVSRSGAFFEFPCHSRSAARFGKPESYVEFCCGFRLAASLTKQESSNIRGDGHPD